MTTERYSGIATSKVGENGKTKNKGNDGGIQIYIIIIVALSLVVVAGVVSFLLKIIMDRRTKESTETEEDNENYGNLDQDQYYEEETKSKIIHSNDYYR